MKTPYNGFRRSLSEQRDDQISIFTKLAPPLNKIEQAVGRTTLEKPGSWEALDGDDDHGYSPWSGPSLSNAESTLDFEIPRVSAAELFGSNTKPRGPLANLKQDSDKFEYRVALVTFSDDTTYFVDLRDAWSYIRTWAKIDQP